MEMGFLTCFQSSGFLKILILLLVSSFLSVSAQEQDICPEPENGRPSCFSRACTWISKYKHHNTPEEIEIAFAGLSDKGITCIYYNVWSNGALYFESPKGRAMNVTIIDTLQYAIDAAKRHQIQLVVWFEYGNIAAYGNLNPFAVAAADKNWLLQNGDSFLGINQDLYIYMDQSLLEVQNFIADILIDALSNYEIDGVQLDDHFIFPNGYNKTDSMSTEEKIQVSYGAMENIASMVKGKFPNKIFSYSPAPLQWAKRNQNIDWSLYFNMTIRPDEIVPQYYRASYDDFLFALNEDFRSLPDYAISTMMAGLRLSGAILPPKTPCAVVSQMIQESENRGFGSVFFWFADNFLDNYYVGLESLFTTLC